MTSTVHERMNGILEFLKQDILPDVSRNHRSELRSAIKLLTTLRDEIDLLPSLIASERTALRQLAEDGLSYVEPTTRGALAARMDGLGFDDKSATLAQQEATVAGLRALVADVAIALSHQRDSSGRTPTAEAALVAIYQQLRSSAGQRTAFQSVFELPLFAAPSAPAGKLK